MQKAKYNFITKLTKAFDKKVIVISSDLKGVKTLKTHSSQGVTGNPSTIAISVYRQILIYGWVKWGTWASNLPPCGWESNPLTIRHIMTQHT